MKIIGIIRTKRDVKRFKHIKIGTNKVPIHELWDDDLDVYYQPIFPAIIYQTPDGLYWLYNNFYKHTFESIVESYDLFTKPQKELLDKLLDHIVLDTFYSSAKEFVKYVCKVNDASDALWIETIKTVIKEYNSAKLLDKEYKVKIVSAYEINGIKKVELNISANNKVSYDLTYKGPYADIKELAIDIVTRLDEICYEYDNK